MTFDIILLMDHQPQAFLDDCEERMRKLEGSQFSIVDCSDLLLKADPSLVPFIV
jgi:hypothetical protein